MDSRKKKNVNETHTKAIFAVEMRFCLMTTKQLTAKRFGRKRIVREEVQLRDVVPAHKEFFKINHHR